MTTYSDPGAIADVVGTSGRIEASWGNAIRDRVINHFASTTARDAAIPSPKAGALCYVTADHCYYARNDSGAWEVFGYLGQLPTWTPGASQSVSVAATVNYARYQKIGRMVIAQGSLTFTGSGTAGQPVLIGLPTTAAVAGCDIGAGHIFNASAGNIGGLCYTAGTTSFGFFDSTALSAGYLGQGGTAFSEGLVNGDATQFFLCYEAAS